MNQCLEAYISAMTHLENAEKAEKGRQLLQRIQDAAEGQTGSAEKIAEIRQKTGPEGYKNLSKAGQSIIFKALAVLLQENYSFETIYNLLIKEDQNLIDSMIADPALWDIEARLRHQGIEEQAAEVITQWRPEDLPF